MILAGLALIFGGCAKETDMAPTNKGQPPPAEARDHVVIDSGETMRASSGKVVEVTGEIERGKLGDIVSGDGFSIVCTGRRVDDALVGSTATVRGKLEVTDAFQATVGPNGEISQGTEPGLMTWFIHDCEVVKP